MVASGNDRIAELATDARRKRATSEGHLELQRIPLSISFFVPQVEAAAQLLDVVDSEHWKQLLAGPWMPSDGTSLEGIVPDLPVTHDGHLEVFLRDETCGGVPRGHGDSSGRNSGGKDLPSVLFPLWR
ncbi:MAG: hypothetical protein JXB39_09820 [Deltaproteobacteria bacterium]|nr:hypothetical protein [Deltaproteobacteria bacterium]